MRDIKLLVLTAAVLLGWAGRSAALDSPHDGSFSGAVTSCQDCHKLHASTGGTLLGGAYNYSSNNDACLTCHDNTPSSPSYLFTNKWSTGREAVLGTSGDQHKWSGPANVAAAGAQTPLDGGLSSHLIGGALQCGTCHDPHGIRNTTQSIQSTYAPSTSVHSSFPLNVAQTPIVPVTGSTGKLKLMAMAGAKPAGYGIKSTSGTTFVISHNYGRGSSKTWGATTYTFAVGDTAAQDVALDDPAVKVRFTATPTVGEEWSFYVSYPFLRGPNVTDQMCLDCHRSRNMTHTTVEGGNVSYPANGTNVFSHPVGQALNANGKSYDRATPLDADGSAADSNPGNDIKMVGGVVSCSSCHAPHNASSNSLSVEVR